MAKIAAAVTVVLLSLIGIMAGGAAAGILKVREMQKKEDAGQW